MSELRWNPLLGEWVATATHRQERTFLPPPDFCPLCPTREGGFRTEVPAPDYEIVVFENKFPSLRREPPAPAVEESELYRVRPAQGVCEVVLYTPRHTTTLAEESVVQIERLIRVWADRFAELDGLDYVRYVYIFENKGEEIGVTLHHPHGQIYGYPFIPPIIARELERARAHRERTGRNLIADIVAEELRDGRRVVWEGERFVACIPFFARWPYETHIYAKRHVEALTDLSAEERCELARVLKRLLVGFDRLFARSFPYVMALHGRPSDGGDYSYYDFHIEFYPPMRAADKLKYLAGSEIGAGMFINDTLAEEKAAELRARIEAFDGAE